MTGAVTVILNSTAGAGCPPEWVEQLREKFTGHGLEAAVKLVRSGADILDTVRQAVAGGAQTVVAGGGDGTVSAVASALVGSDTVLGVLPMGTLNHFAKDLRIPLAQDEAVANIANGRVLAVDAGEVNGRTFINNSSLGLYPDIVRDREQLQRRLGHGKWRALLQASIAAARRYPALTARIEVQDRIWERRTPFVFIGNNEYTMEGFQIGERPTVSDGRLSLYVAQRTGRFGLLRLALLALFSRLDQARDFDIATAQEFVVHTRHKRLRVATDGEVTLMETPLRYRVRPGALRVIVPQQEPPP
ncbi:MAG: diacylglycerol kinase family lipid kinase [Burkholderiales bacterium]|nr:diacylglycerol kinase family lipid kinase [Burkholderiales bacterium]